MSAYATETQVAELRRRAINGVTREIATRGVLLRHIQVIELGEQGLNWIRDRLGLSIQETSDGDVECVPEEG